MSFGRPRGFRPWCRHYLDGLLGGGRRHQCSHAHLPSAVEVFFEPKPELQRRSGTCVRRMVGCGRTERLGRILVDRTWRCWSSLATRFRMRVNCASAPSTPLLMRKYAVRSGRSTLVSVVLPPLDCFTLWTAAPNAPTVSSWLPVRVTVVWCLSRRLAARTNGPTVRVCANGGSMNVLLSPGRPGEWGTG